MSGIEDGGCGTDWLGLGENCGVTGDVGDRLFILSWIVDSGVRLKVCVVFLWTVETIAVCDIVGGDDALVGGMDLDCSASSEK